MLWAIGRLSPASSWNWLANRCNAARLASSRMILSWSLSVIEGTPPVVRLRGRQAGGPQTITFPAPIQPIFLYLFDATRGCVGPPRPTHPRALSRPRRAPRRGPAGGHQAAAQGRL